LQIGCVRLVVIRRLLIRRLLLCGLLRCRPRQHRAENFFFSRFNRWANLNLLNETFSRNHRAG